MPRTFTPTFDKVAVKSIEEDPQQTQGGLIVPKTATLNDDDVPFNSPLGEVVAVGPEVVRLKVGDKVIFTHHDQISQTGKANPIGLDGKLYWVIQEKFVSGVLDQ